VNFQPDVSPIELYEHLMEDETSISYYQFYKENASKFTDNDLHELAMVIFSSANTYL
jgi:hypothetical protein